MNWKVGVGLRFARMIKPGFFTSVIAEILIFILRLISPREDVALRNIERIFPNITKDKKESILSKSYESMIWTGLELCSLYKHPERVEAYVTEVEGYGYLSDAIAKGKGVLALSAHIGNWEVMSAWGGRHFDSAIIVRNADNPEQRKIIEELRGSENVLLLDKGAPMITAVRHLKKGGLLGILSDQYAGDEGIKVPFFGRDTSTAQGCGVFAYLTGAAIIPVMPVRLSPFNIKLKFFPPIEWERKGSRDETVRDITIKCNEALEEMIRENPSQWLWQHRRFREEEDEKC